MQLLPNRRLVAAAVEVEVVATTLRLATAKAETTRRAEESRREEA